MNKKIFSLLSLTALCVGFVACDEVEESLSTPQENPQEPVMSIDGISVQTPAATATAVNLPAFSTTDGQGQVPVLDVTLPETFPTSYALAGKMDISDTEDFEKTKTIDLVADESHHLFAPVEDWETAHLQLYSKNPRPETSYIKITLYAVSGNAMVTLLNGDSKIFNQREVTVTPLPATAVVEEEYSIVANGSETAMAATNPDNVYAPPTFTGMIDVAVDQPFEFTIKSQSGIVYGQSAETPNGLAIGGKPIVVTEDGPHTVTVNMETLTYKVALALNTIYAYSADPAQGYALVADDYVHFGGFAGFAGSSPAFRLANYKGDATIFWGQAMNGATAVNGSIEQSVDPTPIPLQQAGCYWTTVNLEGLTYSTSFCKSFDLIGGWDGWSSDVVMTPTDADCMVWTTELKIDNADTSEIQFKIRTNSSWDGANLGGGNPEDPTDFSNLKEHGENLVWSQGNGTFTVTLDLSNYPYTLTAVKK